MRLLPDDPCKFCKTKKCGLCYYGLMTKGLNNIKKEEESKNDESR